MRNRELDKVVERERRAHWDRKRANKSYDQWLAEQVVRQPRTRQPERRIHWVEYALLIFIVTVMCMVAEMVF